MDLDIEEEGFAGIALSLFYAWISRLKQDKW